MATASLQFSRRVIAASILPRRGNSQLTVGFWQLISERVFMKMELIVSACEDVRVATGWVWCKFTTKVLPRLASVFLESDRGERNRRPCSY